MPGKTIGQKLMLKPGQTFLLLAAPEGYVKALGALPEGVNLTSAASGRVDAIQVFTRTKREATLSSTRMKTTPVP
ncbi:MAG: hypothetical protein ABSA72_09985 [Nitrososphaerales archaeon]|jgi:hypothetical protein